MNYTFFDSTLIPLRIAIAITVFLAVLMLFLFGVNQGIIDTARLEREKNQLEKIILSHAALEAEHMKLLNDRFEIMKLESGFQLVESSKYIKRTQPLAARSQGL
ncbi:hypothetical protein ACFL3E_01235 [Patescibacteria group bacterium]